MSLPRVQRACHGGENRGAGWTISGRCSTGGTARRAYKRRVCCLLLYATQNCFMPNKLPRRLLPGRAGPVVCFPCTRFLGHLNVVDFFLRRPRVYSLAAVT